MGACCHDLVTKATAGLPVPGQLKDDEHRCWHGAALGVALFSTKVMTVMPAALMPNAMPTIHLIIVAVSSARSAFVAIFSLM